MVPAVDVDVQRKESTRAPGLSVPIDAPAPLTSTTASSARPRGSQLPALLPLPFVPFPSYDSTFRAYLANPILVLSFACVTGRLSFVPYHSCALRAHS